jgi:lanosterol synthase
MQTDSTAIKAGSTAPGASDVRQAVARGIDYLESIQREKGCIVGEVVWCPMLTAQYVMTAYMTGRKIPEERKARFLKYFEVWQTHDGGWGMHAESPAYVFVTTLSFVAVRMLGLPAGHRICARARVWLHRNGGVMHIPSWGKMWLSMVRLYDWDAVPAILPELWLLPEWMPVHPGRMYCHTRLIYLGIGYLYGVKFRTPETELIRELREELFDEPFESIDFAAHRFELAPTDTFDPPHPVLKGVYRLCAAYDRLNIMALRKRALDFALDQIVSHQRESRYAAISPVNGLLNTLALYHAGHPEFEPSFEGVDYWAWSDEEEGERFNGAHSHTWDTAFAVQAVCEGPEKEKGRRFLENAGRYLRNAQMADEMESRQRYFRDRRYGGFCFSDEHHRWPVSDCTAEALSALSYLADILPSDRLPKPEMIAEAARFILTRQNKDGGFGSYERQRGGLFLELFNPSEMFGNCMVEHSYVECTAACMHALNRALKRFSFLFTDRDKKNIRKAIVAAEKLLRRSQQPDGSWLGFWGVNCTYGTLFGVTGLLAAGASRTDPAILAACRWLVSARLPDGGWGESYRGCVVERYIPHKESQVIMTSWALMTLLRADYRGPGADEAVEEGIGLLSQRQFENGDWPKEGVGGVFFNTAMHHYCLYKNYFPIWALGLYVQRRA